MMDQPGPRKKMRINPNTAGNTKMHSRGSGSLIWLLLKANIDSAIKKPLKYGWGLI
jgi:hypothetical protein